MTVVYSLHTFVIKSVCSICFIKRTHKTLKNNSTFFQKRWKTDSCGWCTQPKKWEWGFSPHRS